MTIYYPATCHKQPFRLDIATNKDASVTADAEGNESFKVYSDRSAQDGVVGAAAVLIKPGKATCKLQYHLGSAEHHTVFEAELVGLLLGLHLIKTEKKQTSYVNELANKEAKLATEGTSSEPNNLPKLLRKPLQHNKSMAKQEHKSKIKTKWIKEWQHSLHAQRTKHIDSSLLSPIFLKLISDPDISRKGTSWLYQICSGHIPLNTYLHRFKRVESTGCPACGHHNKTTQHFLLDCPAYTHKRWPLITGKSLKNKEYGNLVGRIQNAKLIIKFITDTGRLLQEYTNRVRNAGETGTKHREIGIRSEQQRGIEVWTLFMLVAWTDTQS
jgi:hypothetical protein